MTLKAERRGIRHAAFFAATTTVFALSSGMAVPALANGESPPIAYQLHCMGCHMPDGTGAKIGRIPAIPGITGHFLKHPKGRAYLVNVPGVVNAALPDGETAGVLNYILDRFGKSDMPADAKPFTAEEVHELRKAQINDISALRQEISSDLAKQGIDLHY
jgi:hypothetical protein